MSLNRSRAYRGLLTGALILLASAQAHALTHTVKETDTLFGLSLKYNIPQSWIIRANNLKNETIRTGAKLDIPEEGLRTLHVRPGDTLSSLAIEFRVSQQEILQLNNLKDSRIRIGQKLKLPEPLRPGTCRVLQGDTLTAIAKRSSISVEQLRAYNALDNDTIHPGDVLTIQPGRPDFHQVENGESLWSIATQYKLSMAELKQWNTLDAKAVIHPGAVLVLHPGLNPQAFRPAAGNAAQAPASTPQGSQTPAFRSPSPRPPDTGSHVSMAAVNSTAPAGNKKAAAMQLPRKGEYFYSSPKRNSQPNNTYWEESDTSVLTDYNRAQKVLKVLEEDVQSLPKLSDRLAGRHIVIDPGHGGLDPGAAVTVQDGNGNPITIVEDEYAYDIAIRLYRILRRHGASVSLTVVSPDHLSREGENPRQTFVNKKNEVYNHESHNGNAGWRPVGTTEGLDMRKTIAAGQIRNAPHLAKRKGTLFISIHADISPELPAGRAVLFDGVSEKEKEASRALAQCMAKHLGAGSFIKNQPLRVLQNNPADAAVLVETRNVHYPQNCWALRSPELREQDALMLADGILQWAAH